MQFQFGFEHRGRLRRRPRRHYGNLLQNPEPTSLNPIHSGLIVQWKAWQIAHITEDEFFRTLDEAWFEWKSIPPVNHDIGEAVRRIRRFGRVDVVTGRSQSTVQAAMAWLQEHNVSYDTFVRTASGRAKAGLSYDVFIDDSAELMSLVSSSLDKFGILYTQPWNREAADMHRIFRVEGWEQVPALLEKVSAIKG